VGIQTNANGLKAVEQGGRHTQREHSDQDQSAYRSYRLIGGEMPEKRNEAGTKEEADFKLFCG